MHAPCAFSATLSRAFPLRIGRRRKGQGKHFQEEVDRFNEDGDDGDDKVKQKRKKGGLSSSLKSGRDIKDVEGAEDDWEHSEDSEEEEERRKYEDESGFKVEAFNMDMEREEGHFDAASGHYVEDKFKMSQRDAWLDEVNEKYAHGLQKKLASKKEEEDEMEEDEMPPEEMLFFLHSQLGQGETVAAALRRMKADKDVSSEAFDKVTIAADKLLAAGYHSVFADKKESMLAKMKPETRARVAAEAAGPAADSEGGSAGDARQWEYKLEFDESTVAAVVPSKMSIKELRAFLDSNSVSYQGIVEKEDLEAKARQTVSRIRNQADEAYGPFSTADMQAWAAQGYFSGPKVVLIREVGSADFLRSDRVDVDEMLAAAPSTS